MQLLRRLLGRDNDAVPSLNANYEDAIPSYEANYELIARTHLDSYCAGRGNPWMPPELIEKYERSTASLIRSHTPKGGAILDAGCALAGLFSRLPADYFCLVGLDLSADYLEIARERVPAAAFHEGRIEQMPFEDASFDTVVTADVLEHVLHLDDALRELLRVLKPGGKLIVRAPIEPSLAPYLEPDFPYYYVHVRRFEEADLILLFTRCFDCEVVETKRVSFGEFADINVVVKKPSNRPLDPP
jgi:ubiquinone/menaquinone biosynthesis C-methylase UbiE